MARAIDSEVAFRFLTEQLVKETGAFSKGVNKGLNIARSAMRNPDAIPTLNPPNEWVSRVQELDELYTKLQIVTGFTAEQLLEIFAAGYTLEKPDYSKKFAEMENLAEAAQPNEPLTLEQLRQMDGEPVWVEDVKHWALIDIEKGGQWDGMPFAVWAENGVKFTYNVKSRDLHCYRRPPEGEEDA